LTSSLDTLLDMLKAYAGIKECSEETQAHLNMVNILKINPTADIFKYLNFENFKSVTKFFFDN
jgi:hypothetical protein